MMLGQLSWLIAVRSVRLWGTRAALAFSRSGQNGKCIHDDCLHSEHSRESYVLDGSEFKQKMESEECLEKME